jgi:hypothetical protein
MLLMLKGTSRALYTHDWRWVGKVPEKAAWDGYRLVAILNHTSLYEVLLAGGIPRTFIRRMAKKGIVPVASKTIDRPLIGTFFKLVAGNVVSISRERDETWEKVMTSVDPNSMVIILPEGRMKRANGLDGHGRPLVIRSGIHDLLKTIPDGKMLLAYSHGLHHIQVPGQTFPKLFKTINLRLEELDIATYKASLAEDLKGKSLKAAMLADLTLRRDHHCDPEKDGQPLPEAANAG